MADALVSMYMSKRTWSRDLERSIRHDWAFCARYQNAFEKYKDSRPIKDTKSKIERFCKYAWMHTTMLDFVTISVTVEGIHRAGQDDIDAHAKRFDNRIIRSSTRLADFEEGEVSKYYQDKIIPTDVALKMLGIDLPESIERDGKTFVKAVNGYIKEDMKDNRDVKRGLYMESIPSNFIFKCNMAQWAHVYRLRNEKSGANPEVKECVEKIQNKIEAAMPWFNREFLAKVQI